MRARAEVHDDPRAWRDIEQPTIVRRVQAALRALDTLPQMPRRGGGCSEEAGPFVCGHRHAPPFVVHFSKSAIVTLSARAMRCKRTIDGRRTPRSMRLIVMV